VTAMPDVEHDFCGAGYAWVCNKIATGTDLHFLCNDRWFGKCSSSAREHSFFCLRFFHRRHFQVPAEFHSKALACFFCSKREDTETQLDEYACELVKNYTLSDVLSLLRLHSELRPALLKVFRRWPEDRPFVLNSVDLWGAVNYGYVPCRLLPKRMEDLSDHARASSSVLVACSALGWLKKKERVHASAFPALVSTVRHVLARLPPELVMMILRFIFV